MQILIGKFKQCNLILCNENQPRDGADEQGK
jgi:hypothetical protein